VIEPAVQKFTMQELEELNETYRQATAGAMKFDFAQILRISQDVHMKVGWVANVLFKGVLECQ